jgi:hypothetical protein
MDRNPIRVCETAMARLRREFERAVKHHLTIMNRRIVEFLVMRSPQVTGARILQEGIPLLGLDRPCVVGADRSSETDADAMQIRKCYDLVQRRMR